MGDLDKTKSPENRGQKTKFNFNPETGEYYDEEFENAMSMLGDEFDIEEEDYDY